MNRCFLAGGVFWGFLVLWTAGQALAVEVDIGPEAVTMRTLEARKPAEFPHRMHQKILACMECHHTKGQTMTVDNCRNCHNKDMADEKLDSLKEVGHKLCSGCHKAYKKETRAGSKNAPLKCSGCHPIMIKNR